MTEPIYDITRAEIGETYALLTQVAQALEIGVYYLPDSTRTWAIINVLEELAREVDEDNPDLNAHIRAAAAALDELRSAHNDLDDVVAGAEAILRGSDTDLED